ncbi:Cytochrome P450 CYP2 subfamily [Handroanthus impetiginosus]|uniref:Flavonoid-6-hydroxylase n=1 Tax=Handroanthus impetiginosus TaxID=429701 RepID=A0A2G9HB91_9LAMI|nr:Cytochrome P450 CYP2 subfamily [Handroanthus impetiginosus]
MGHLHLMIRSSPDKLPYLTLTAMADKYGSIFTIRLGVRRAVVIRSSELAKEIFTKCDAVVSSRPQLLAPKHLGYETAMLGFSPYGSYWREMRKLVSSELLSNRRRELQMRVLESEIKQSIKELYQLWEKNRDGGHEGVRYFGSGDCASDEARRLMRDFFQLAGLFVVGDAVPFLRWFDIWGYEKKMKETSTGLDLLVRKLLEEHKQKDKETEQDFMDVMLSIVGGTKLQGYYDDDTIVKATSANLIVGATDTTSVMLVWALSLLLNNTHILKNAQQELDDRIGKQRRVDPSDIKNLIYLQAIVKETLRLYPPIPLGGLQEFTEDCNVGGYHIRKGTRMMVNLWKLHRDPHACPDDPSEFRPERFLTTHNDVDVKGQDFELLPFGSGRRICPGASFGLQMSHLVLADILHAFELSTPAAGGVVDMSGSAGSANNKATPLEVLLAPRLCANL